MASEQQFCLRWNNHQSTLVAVFDTLLESGTLVDCTLAAEGQYLKAHKVVLSACSPYFELLLSQHNEKHPIVILKDVKFQELKAMMDYMYRGEVNISQDQLGALLKAAESLQIKGLSDSGGGNERESSDRRHSRKEAPAPQPPPARSPPSTHSSSSGLTIEHRRSSQQAAPPVVELPEDSPPSGSTPHIGGSREGSVSPIPRKRKRHRRRSSTEDGTQGLLPMTDSHDQTSSSCELPPQSQPAPATNIPAIISPVVPAPSTISRAASDPISSVGPDEQTDSELRRSSLPPSQPNLPPVEGLPPDPEPIQKLEPMSEVLLEPKSEYLDDTMNEDSVENLTTLDDVDDMDDARPGPSHGGEGSSNQGSGFAPWHVRATDRTTDEVFMAAQEVVGAQRDSQDGSGSVHREENVKVKFETLRAMEQGDTIDIDSHMSERNVEDEHTMHTMMITPELLGLIPSSSGHSDLSGDAVKGSPKSWTQEHMEMSGTYGLSEVNNETTPKTGGGGPKTWTQEDMEMALDALRNHNMSLTKASATYGIPSTTLWQRAHRLGIDTPKKEGPTKSWTEDNLNSALEALRTGTISANKASKAYGIPSSTLYKIARREGIRLAAPFNAAPTTWSPDDLERALESIRSGASSVQRASTEFGIPTGTLYGRCKREGIELSRSNPTPWSEDAMGEALEAVRLGQMSINQAAIHYNLPYSSLYGRFKRGEDMGKGTFL